MMLTKYQDSRLNCEALCISELHVEEKHRRKGIASELLFIAEQIARHFNLNNITLCTIQNRWVKEWYNKLGFIDGYIDTTDSNFIWLIKSLNYDTI